MRRALLVLLLVAGCSHGSSKALPSPSASPSATPVAVAPTTTPPAPPSATPSRSAAAPVGPVGTRVPRGFVPRSATFVSARAGWVLGFSPCPSGKGSCDVIARTRDGGASWRAIPSPATSPDKLARIRFADARNGFVSGEQLWATHDGGATWKVVPGMSDVSDLAAAGGRVWVTREQVLRSAPVGGGAFVREQDLVVGFWVRGGTVVFSRDTGPALFVTSHGRPARQLDGPCADADRPAAGLGAHWMVVCEGEGGLGHQEKRAFTSTDEGATWKAAGDPPPRSGSDVFVTGDGDVVVDHQEVAVRRGGAWHTALSSQGGLSEAGFESAGLGYAIGGFGDSPDQTMRLSHDAGRTWRTAAF